ncbi:MAG: hypothetical protein U1D55_13215 [Phycisphaerae bacterium]
MRKCISAVLTPKQRELACASQRKFYRKIHELNYLYVKILYWMYERGIATRAKPFAIRAKRILRRHKSDDPGLLVRLARSVLAELDGKFDASIAQIQAMLTTIYEIAPKFSAHEMGLVLDPYVGPQSLGRLVYLLRARGRSAEADAELDRAREFLKSVNRPESWRLQPIEFGRSGAAKAISLPSI